MWRHLGLVVLLLTCWGGSYGQESDNAETEEEAESRQVCRPSVTVVNGKKSCVGKLIFEDNFDGDLDETTWRKDKLIANNPDFEFVLYDSNPKNVFIKDGVLHLKPNIVDTANNYLTNGVLDLRKKGCTGQAQNECYQKASSYNILPPIASGRVKTSQSFSFQYGTIEIRAKLPEGNWLYPELRLEPLEHFYGPGYSSGLVWVAMARGNPELLLPDGEDVGAKHLQAGMVLSGDQLTRYTAVRSKTLTDAAWNEGFHNYRITWQPDGMVMSVDGVDFDAVVPPANLGFSSMVRNERWSEGTDMAPFDKEFYITLGLGVGGVRDFPDNSTTGGIPKPWRNTGAKAKLDFWRDRVRWQDSWAWEEAALQVDYVKVWAL